MEYNHMLFRRKQGDQAMLTMTNFWLGWVL